MLRCFTTNVEQNPSQKSQTDALMGLWCWVSYVPRSHRLADGSCMPVPVLQLPVLASIQVKRLILSQVVMNWDEFFPAWGSYVFLWL